MSDDLLKYAASGFFYGLLKFSEPMAKELQQYRQREERRGE